MAPTIVFVPGFWEGLTVFDKATLLLKSQGYTTQVASLLSTGTASPIIPNMNDDIANIRSTIPKVVDAEEDVLLDLHSAGGILGPAAFEGSTKKYRQEKGLKGGVVNVLFLTAGIWPLGSLPPVAPFFQIDVGRILPYFASNSVNIW
jgi:hypothetical protein